MLLNFVNLSEDTLCKILVFIVVSLNVSFSHAVIESSATFFVQLTNS